jgi:5-methylcytosine-specific restriction enzyme A
MRAEPATLTPALSQREREEETTCFLSALSARKALISGCEARGMKNGDWIDLPADSRHVSRERDRARTLRASPWWRKQLKAGRCHYCGGCFPPSELTMDHVIPVARGGRSVKGNVVPACSACNRTKRHLTPAEQVLAQLERDSPKKQDKR